jgi:hypothetical protein
MHRWLIPVILASQKAEFRKSVILSQHGQIILKTLSQKNLPQKRAGTVGQGVGPEFKPQYHQKKNNNNN